MTTLERHMLGLALITMANISAAFVALKTFEFRLWSEAQKTHIEAPIQQEYHRPPYEPKIQYRLANRVACCDTVPSTVLTLDRVKILSE